MMAYHRRLNGLTPGAIGMRQGLERLGGSTITLLPDPRLFSSGDGSDRFALAFARIENHYFVSGGNPEDQLSATPTN